MPGSTSRPVRIGAVNYLNSKPLIEGLSELAPQAELVLDYPSRLADRLVAGRLDVALIPSIECVRTRGYEIVPDACVAAHGPVLSVKLYSRVDPSEIRTLALDDGSRTSQVLVQILLAKRFAIRPELELLPADQSVDATRADAVLLIGDRAIHESPEPFATVWDLGDEWWQWTGLPFVFAMWVTRSGTELGEVEGALCRARDLGIERVEQIARREAPLLDIPQRSVFDYLTKNLHYHLGAAEREGLSRFQRLAVELGLAPGGIDIVYRSADRGIRGEADAERGRRGDGAMERKGEGETGRGGDGAKELPNRIPLPLSPSLPASRCPRVSASATDTRHAQLLKEAVDGRRLTAAEGLALIESNDLIALGEAAHAVSRRLHPEPFRTYSIDRNINYTNACTAVCNFCAFYRPPGHEDVYVLDREVLLKKIEETVALGGDQILLQGGLHPKLPLSWYEELLGDVKRHFPQVNVHGFSPPEIHHFTKVSKLPLRTVLERLKQAGLGSIPGGGAEILVDRVRKEITRGKVLTDDWLAVHRVWHELGGRSTATMMFGHVETLAERIEHLERLRQLQDETGGFTAFICWTFQPPNTAMSHVPPVGAFEYLKTLAVSRLYLDNFRNIQSSWVTQGEKIGQLGLLFGANDMGSLMIEENVVAETGCVHYLSLATIRRCIEGAGYIPRQRNVFYEYIDEFDEAEYRSGSDRREPLALNLPR